MQKLIKILQYLRLQALIYMFDTKHEMLFVQFGVSALRTNIFGLNKLASIISIKLASILKVDGIRKFKEFAKQFHDRKIRHSLFCKSQSY